MKQAILQEAIAGQLTAEWRTQNPMEKGNPDTDAAALLAKIKAEKQQLIADGKLKKEKPLPEVAIDEIQFCLPENWILCRLGEIFEFKNGDRSDAYPSGSDIKKSGVPFINSKMLVNNKVDLNSPYIEYISEDKFRSLRSGKVMNNDLLMVLRGATRGKIGVFKSSQEFTTGFINAQLLIIRDYFGQEQKYLCYFFNSNMFTEIIGSITSGTAQPHYSAGSLSNSLLPLPPLAEQKAIVEKVDRLMNIIDQLEQQIKHRKQLAEDLMQTVLREAFE